MEHLYEKRYSSLSICKTRDKRDCAAVFWKNSKFKCLGTWRIELGKDDSISYLYDKPQVACFVALKVEKERSKQIIIAGTSHIIYSKEFGDIKLAQLNLITQCLSKIRKYVYQNYPEFNISILFGGDFNSSPNSGIYQYMSEGQYDFKSQNRDEISGQKHNDQITENAFFESIKKLNPNPNADINNVYQSFIEITNTEIYFKNKNNSKHFKFKFRTDIDAVNELSAELERVVNQSINHEQCMKQMSQLSESDHSSDSEEDINDEHSDDEITHFETIDNFELILENPCGMFKSAYSEAMNNFKDLLFCKEDDSEYIQLINNLNADYKTSLNIIANQNKNVFYGAFKPNIYDQKEFENYWDGANMEPACSIFTDKMILVDYLWYQSESLKVLRVLDVPNVFDELSKFTICPNKLVPSDHFPIVSDFCFE